MSIPAHTFTPFSSLMLTTAPAPPVNRQPPLPLRKMSVGNHAAVLPQATLDHCDLGWIEPFRIGKSRVAL
jgi:hypothetical protein